MIVVVGVAGCGVSIKMDVFRILTVRDRENLFMHLYQQENHNIDG